MSLRRFMFALRCRRVARRMAIDLAVIKPKVPAKPAVYCLDPYIDYSTDSIIGRLHRMGAAS